MPESRKNRRILRFATAFARRQLRAAVVPAAAASPDPAFGVLRCRMAHLIFRRLAASRLAVNHWRKPAVQVPRDSFAEESAAMGALRGLSLDLYEPPHRQEPAVRLRRCCSYWLRPAVPTARRAYQVPDRT